MNDGIVAVLLDPQDPQAAALSGWAMAAFYRVEILGSRAALADTLAQGRPALLIVSETLFSEDDLAKARVGAVVKVISALEPAELGRLITCTADDLIVLPTTKAEFVLRCRRAMEHRHAGQGAAHLRPPQDPLTETATRAALPEIAEALHQRAAREGLSIVAHLFDVRGILRINETLGRAVGDRLLKDFVARLRGALTPGATLVRVGGHEFAVLDLARDERAAALDAGNYHALMQPPFDVAGEQLSAGATVGYAVQGDALEPLETLLDEAAQAAREARSRGEGLGALTPEAPVSPGEIAMLRAALAQNEFRLHYQRQIDLTTGAVAGVETLLRWQKPGSGLLLPGSFLPLVRRAGLLGEMSAHVLRAAMHAAMDKARRDTSAPQSLMRIAVNVSAEDLLNGTLKPAIEAALAETGFAREKLEIELPFAALRPETGQLRAMLGALNTLHRDGLSLTLETPGEVLSSAFELQGLPVCRLKLDPAFMDTARAEFIARRAREAGLVLVCGGIENPKQLAAARALGCCEAQGHYLGYPQAEM